MNGKSSMAGWVAFAAMIMMVIAGVAFFEGLIAIFEDEYFVATAAGFLVVDLTTWGWIMVIWGILLFLVALGLIAGQGWARWFSIIAITLNFFAQLGFLGNAQYPLWALTALALNVIVLFALTARWSESKEDLQKFS